MGKRKGGAFLSVTEILIGLIVGSILGSYIACMKYRIPRKISIWQRSRCPNCNHKLSVIDLIPILGYFINGARCRYCGVNISTEYLKIEIITAITTALAFYLIF